MTQADATMSVSQLAGSVRGPVLTPADPEYVTEVACFNAMVMHTPAVVVGATCTEDVQAAVRWATANGLRVSVQATGHGVEVPITDGLLITTARMQDLSIDPRSRIAIIGAGVKWRRVIDEAAPFGLAPLNGSSSDVGAIGYTLGGGLPVLGRTFGFASDHVVAFDVVTADDEARRATVEDSSELFWALRGGKPDVGIVTSMTVELLPVPQVYGGAIYYDGTDAPRVLRRFAEWCVGLPEEMNASLLLLRLPDMPVVPEPLRDRFTVQLAVAYVGDEETGAGLLAPMREIAPTIIDSVATMPYTEVDRVFNDPEDPIPLAHTNVVVEDLSPDAIDALLAEAGPGVETPVLMVQIRHLGGAMLRRVSDDAVDVRNAGYAVMFLGVMFPEIAAIVPPAIERGCEALAPFGSGASFVNLHGAARSEDDRLRPWKPETVERLRTLKRRLDPDGRFRFGHWA